MKRFNVLNCGRRFGKDVIAMDLLIDCAIEGNTVGWFSPTYKNLTEVWRTLTYTLESVTVRRSEQEHRLDLIGGGVVDMWSLDQPDSARGRAYRRVVINEAAMVARLQEAWENVIRPSLTDHRGDALFLSTPKGFNFFKTLYDRGQDPEQDEWQSWTFPTSANPFIDPAEIEAARRELPESVFAQEYLASFISDDTVVFRNLLNAAILDPQEYNPTHQYVVGCDWGKIADYSVFSVVDVTSRQQVYIDRSNRIDYILQVQRLKTLCDRYHVSLAICETNAMGQAIVEQVQRAGIRMYGWTTTQATKQRMIEDLALAFEQQELTILRDPLQLAELQAFGAERLQSGMMRYSAPEGQHDDTVIALALAWQGARAPERGQVRQRSFQVVP